MHHARNNHFQSPPEAAVQRHGTPVEVAPLDPDYQQYVRLDELEDEGADEEFLNSFDTSPDPSSIRKRKVDGGSNRKKRLSLTEIRAMNVLKKQGSI